MLQNPLNNKIIDSSCWKEVWMKFKEGDIKAFELIYDAHVDFLFCYGMKLTADSELVEDSIHDLFLYLLSKKNNLTNPDFLRYYLLKAFKRILFDKIKQETRWHKTSEEVSSFDFVIDTEVFSHDKEKERKLELIEQLVENLDPHKKEVIFLKFHSGLNYKQIADVVGIQPSSAKKIVYRTISSFREIFKNTMVEFFSIFIKMVRAV